MNIKTTILAALIFVGVSCMTTGETNEPENEPETAIDPRELCLTAQLKQSFVFSLTLFPEVQHKKIRLDFDVKLDQMQMYEQYKDNHLELAQQFAAISPFRIIYPARTAYIAEIIVSTNAVGRENFLDIVKQAIDFGAGVRQRVAIARGPCSVEWRQGSSAHRHVSGFVREFLEKDWVQGVTKFTCIDWNDPRFREPMIIAS